LQTLEQAESDKKAAKTASEQAAKAHAELAAQIKSLERDLGDKAEKSEAELKKQIRDLEGGARNDVQKYERLKRECGEMKEQLEAKRRDRDQKIKVLEGEVSRLERRIVDLETEIKVFEGVIGERNVEIRKLTASLETKTGEYDELKDLHAKTLARAAHLTQEVARARDGEKRATEHVQRLQSDARADKQTDAAELQRLQQAVQRLRKSVDDANTRADTAEQDMLSWRDEVIALTDFVTSRLVANSEILVDFMQHGDHVVEAIIRNALVPVLVAQPGVGLRLMRLHGIHPDGVAHWLPEDFQVRNLPVQTFTPGDMNELYHFIRHCAQVFREALVGWPEKMYRAVKGNAQQLRLDLFRGMTELREAQDAGWWHEYVLVCVNNEEREGTCLCK
jgi:predicted  nucleic acid-binding Zn-ribbon protein